MCTDTESHPLAKGAPYTERTYLCYSGVLFLDLFTDIELYGNFSIRKPLLGIPLSSC